MTRQQRIDEYDQHEVRMTQRKLDALDKQPLADRKEARREFKAAMASNPNLVANRIDWMLDGNYGRGPYVMARQVMGMTSRANKAAMLTQMIAGLDWSCPDRFARTAYKKLTQEQQDLLTSKVQTIIDEWVEAQKEE